MTKRMLGAVLLTLIGAVTAHAQPPADEPVTPSELIAATGATPAATPAAMPPAPTMAPNEPSAPLVHSSICNFGPMWGGPGGKYWFQAEYLYWWLRSERVPPLVTTSPSSTAFGEAGVIGRDQTTVVFGREHVEERPESGLRGSGGFWLRDDHAVGIEASYFQFQDRRNFFNVTSDATGTPIIARPFTSAFTFDEQAYLVAFPGALAGGVSVEGSTRLWGAEANVVMDMSQWMNCQGYLLLGARYLDLANDVNLQSESTVLAGGAIGFRGNALGVGDRVVVQDTFDACNHFIGAQIGVRRTFACHGLDVEVTLKAAFGHTTQTVEAQGFSTAFGASGLIGASPGGLLALPSNSQRQVGDRFSIIPETNIRITYKVMEGVSVHLGYDFLLWHDVVRAGDQITREVNVAQVPTSLAFTPGFGPNFPMPVLRASDFWAQGVNAGVTLRY